MCVVGETQQGRYVETKEDFIQAMRAMPDDVVLMCAFSDWLEEHDDPMWEGMRLLAEYRITGHPNGYFDYNKDQDIGKTWYYLKWKPCFQYNRCIVERILICEAFAICDEEVKDIIRRELAELYPNSDAMRAAVDRSTPA